ncbi:MAG: zf-HC2 domain-containing protein [Gemmatimonadota bacterium]
MNCDRCRDHLDAYRDGTLDLALRAEIEAHLAGCAGCTLEADAARAIGKAVSELPRTVLPRDDLWPAIQGRLKPRTARGTPQWGFLAAAVALVVASSAITKVVIERRHENRAAAPVIASEVTYLRLAGNLAAALDSLRPKMAPETQAVVERNLAIIDRALRESRQALAKDPHNDALEDLLLSAYRQKIDWLKRAASYAKT